MFGYQRELLLSLVIVVMLGPGIVRAIHTETPQTELIKDDVIRDEVENQTQKVIRLSPLDLPSKKDSIGNINSALIQIKTIRPGATRKYIDSQRMRRPLPYQLVGEEMPVLKYTPELKPFPKQRIKQQKQLHFVLDQPSGSDVSLPSTSQTLPVEVAPGTYPVYYVVSKTNGRFGKFPIKAFRSQLEFAKYLVKSKVEPIPLALRFDQANR